MKIDFRQGIVSHPESTGGQAFLQVTGGGASVNILTGSGETVVAFAHRTADYLHTEVNDVSPAWSGITPGTDTWLYWDIDPQTAVVTYGFTIVQPTFGPTQPSTLVADLHWFNTFTSTMQVYDGTKFNERIRVFAARINATTLFPMGSSTSKPFTDSQVGVNQTTFAGQILFASGLPVIVSVSGTFTPGQILTGSPPRVTTNPFARIFTFATTETQFLTGGSQKITSVRLESDVTTAKASENMAAYQVVKWSSFSTIALADYNDTTSTTIGILTDDVSVNNVTNVLVQGVIENEAWNFTTVGAELFILANGTLTESDPNITNPTLYPVSKPPVARVLSQKEIIFMQGLGKVGPRGLNPASIGSIDDVTLTQPVALGDVIRFAGSPEEWQNSRSLIDELADVTITSAVDGQTLTFSGSPALWRNAFPLPFTPGDGLELGSPITSVRVDSTVARLNVGSPGSGSPQSVGQTFTGNQTFADNVLFEKDVTIQNATSSAGADGFANLFLTSQEPFDSPTPTITWAVRGDGNTFSINAVDTPVGDLLGLDIWRVWGSPEAIEGVNVYPGVGDFSVYNIDQTRFVSISFNSTDGTRNTDVEFGLKGATSGDFIFNGNEMSGVWWFQDEPGIRHSRDLNDNVWAEWSWFDDEIYQLGFDSTALRNQVSGSPFRVSLALQTTARSFLIAETESNHTPTTAPGFGTFIVDRRNGSQSSQFPAFMRQGSPGGTLTTYAMHNVVSEITYRFDDATNATDPSTGGLKFDNATPASVTNLYIDDLSLTGDEHWMLSNLSTGDILTIRVATDQTDYLIVSVSSTPTDNTGWWTIPVSIISSGTLPTDNDLLAISVQWFSNVPGLGSPSAATTLVLGDLLDVTGGGADGDLLINSSGTWIPVANAAGPTVLDVAALGTTPTLIPDRSDPDTGIGHSAADALSLVAGGTEVVRYTASGGGVLHIFDASVGISIGSPTVQGQGVVSTSYNTISSAGGGAVTLPATFPVGTVIYIKNDTATDVSVFPALGDTITPNAVNIPVALPAGEGVTFMGTVADSTWTKIIVSGIRGLSDVSITGGVGSPTLPETGDILFYDGTNWVNLPRGTANQVLTLGSPLIPSWSDNITETIVIGSPIVQTAIASHSITLYRSAEFTVQATRGTNFHTTKIIAIHGGSPEFADFTEFGTLTIPSFFGSPLVGSPAISGAQATFDVDVSGGNLRLLATPVEGTGSITFKVVSNLITV